MANANSASQTAYSDVDWLQYNKYRPAYPTSLKHLIYKYHGKHAQADWTRLVDVGSGIGISTMPYLADFEIIQLLDPSSMNQEKARVFLEQKIASDGLQTKLEFIVAKAEQSNVTDASLVICATTAHWIDPELLIESMARMIRPLGTMAIYTYGFPIFPHKSPELAKVFAKALTAAMRSCLRPGDEVTRSVFAGAASRHCAGPRILDSIAVPDEHFEDVRRIRINPAAEYTLKVYHDDPPVFGQPDPLGTGPHEREFVYTTGEDAEAEGWEFTVDLEWLYGVINTIVPSDAKHGPEQQEKLYGDLGRLWKAECPSGSAQSLWPVNIILAKRRAEPVV